LYNFGNKALAEFLRSHSTAKNEPTTDIRVYQGGLFFKKEAAVKGTEEDPVIDWTFSTEDGDRVGDSIQQDGIQLENYAQNNVVLWAHDHSRPAIGLASEVSKDGNLTGKISFVSKAIDHFGWSIGQKARLGIIKAGSVGIRILEWEWLEDEKAEAVGYDFIIKKSELLEFSMCNVPANPFALQKQIASIDSLEAFFKQDQDQPEVEADKDKDADNSTDGTDEAVGLETFLIGGK